MLFANMLMEITADYITHLIASGLKHTITHQCMLPSIVYILLCFMLGISVFRVVLSEKPNSLLGSLTL